MKPGFVSVTRLRIRKWRFLPAFAVHAMKANRQVRGAPGFRGGSLLTDRRWTFWTLTEWDDEGAMRAYMTNGPHRAAMPKLVRWCDEASVVHWHADAPGLPDWNVADERMRRDGRPSRVRHPSGDHAAMAFATPRTALANALKPR